MACLFKAIEEHTIKSFCMSSMLFVKYLNVPLFSWTFSFFIDLKVLSTFNFNEQIILWPLWRAVQKKWLQCAWFCYKWNMVISQFVSSLSWLLDEVSGGLFCPGILPFGFCCYLDVHSLSLFFSPWFVVASSSFFLISFLKLNCTCTTVILLFKAGMCGLMSERKFLFK